MTFCLLVWIDGDSTGWAQQLQDVAEKQWRGWGTMTLVVPATALYTEDVELHVPLQMQR